MMDALYKEMVNYTIDSLSDAAINYGRQGTQHALDVFRDAEKQCRTVLTALERERDDYRDKYLATVAAWEQAKAARERSDALLQQCLDELQKHG